MTGWLERMRRAGKASVATEGPSLAERLRDYPADELPYPGASGTLSAAQAQANFDHVMRVKDARLDALDALLQLETGVAVRPLVDAQPPRWGSLATADRKRRSVDAGGPRSGPDIVYTLVQDLALALGECVVRSNPDWRWAVDLEPLSRERELDTQGRAILRAEAVGSATEPFLLDPEAEVLAQILEYDHASRWALNEWQLLVREAVEGEHQAWFREQAGLPR
jgi:hypothetical protein